MSWNKWLLLSASLLFSGISQAGKISCPDSLTVNNKSHRLNDISVFQGPPEKLGELMPDTQDDMVWTLEDYQDYVRKMDMPLHLVCRYKGTKKTVDLRVPDTAKKCSAWFGDNKYQFYSSCE